MRSLTGLAGGFLVASLPVVVAGALLWFTRRDAIPPAIPASRVVLERGLVMAAVVLTAAGLLLLGERMRGGDGFPCAFLGGMLYLLAGAALLVAEATGLQTGAQVYPLIVVYVVLAFLGQAAVGVGLLGSDLVPAGVAWTTIMWNLGLLVALVVVTPGDIYYPIAHHLMPAVIGIALWIGRWIPPGT